MKSIFVTLVLTSTLTLSAAGGGRIASMLVHLSGDQEVPSISNAFIGRLAVDFDDDLSAADVDLTVFAANVTGAHLHCGPAGANGPIVVSLLPGGLFFPPENALGSIGKVMITNDDIVPRTVEECGMPINNIASLLAAILANNIYVNVHSSAFPAGALRAQLWGHLAP